VTRAASQRTCVSCREKGAREVLVRLVIDPNGALVVDYRAKLPGRGCWIHPDHTCVQRLEEKPGLLKRHLDSVPDTSSLGASLGQLIQAAVLDGVSMAAAAGALVGGRDLLEKALREERILHVVVANDAAERTLGALRHASGGDISFTTVPLNRVALGRRVGKGARAALGVTRSRASVHLLRSLRRLHGMG
jgi:uncharacterized protein